MATERKYKLKRKHLGDILAYRGEDGKTHRIYGRLADDKFAEDFLKNGSKEQIASREKMFEETPKTAKKSGKNQKKAQNQKSQNEPQKSEQKSGEENDSPSGQVSHDNEATDLKKQNDAAAAKAAVSPRENEEKSGEETGEQDEKIQQITEKDLDEFEPEIQKVEDMQTLDKIEQAEKENKDRVGAKEIIQERREAIRKDANEEKDNLPRKPKGRKKNS